MLKNTKCIFIVSVGNNLAPKVTTFFNEMAEFPHFPIKKNNIQRNY